MLSVSRDKIRPKPVLETVTSQRRFGSHQFQKWHVWQDSTRSLTGWSKSFPIVSSFMGATMGKWGNKLIESIALNICETICKKESKFDNIWRQGLQHKYSFCLIFGMKAQYQRIGKLYDLVNQDSIVHRAKEEYAKKIERIKQNLRSGNPFVSRSRVSQGAVNDCIGAVLLGYNWFLIFSVITS